MKNSPLPGLYIVATPIGNLGDMTLRAVELLSVADLVACEDKRVTAKLFHHFQIKRPLTVYNDHSTPEDRARLIDAARTGIIALVSDAGTPLISDPGFKLVRDAREAGITVVSIPGACAAIAGLSIAGLPTDRFLFAGFLPSKAKARADAIAELRDVRSTLVLYESGPRLGTTLSALAETLGGRDGAVARELTKLHEECVTGSLAELAERYRDEPPKGEIVIVIAPPSEDETAVAAPDDVDQELYRLLGLMPPAKAAKEVARKYALDRNEVYDRAMVLKRDAPETPT